MTVKRYLASSDNTITNAFKANLSDRGTEGNMGESDILEVFSIFAQANTSSVEKSRILIQFPVEKIYSDRGADKIPLSGSVIFKTRLYNARHSQSTMEKYFVIAKPIVKVWEEGYGLDMEQYSNEGASNWISGSSTESWSNLGGDYIDETWVSGTLDSSKVSGRDIKIYSCYVSGAADNVEVDITDLMEQWLIGEETQAAATASLVITGGTDASRKTALSNAGTTFKLTDATGNSQIFTFSVGTDANVGGTIGIQSDTNTTQIAASIRSAINSLHSLRMTAAAAVATGDADSAMTIKITQHQGGKSGNTDPVVSAAATSAGVSVSKFSGGSGVTQAVTEMQFKTQLPDTSTIKLYSTDGSFATFEFGPAGTVNGSIDGEGNVQVEKESTVANTVRNFAYAVINRAMGSMSVNASANIATTISAMHNKSFTLTDTAGNSQKFTFDQTVETTNATAIGTIGLSNDSHVLHIAESIVLAISNATNLNISALAPVASTSDDNNSTHKFKLIQDSAGSAGETAVDVSSITQLTSSAFVGNGLDNRVTHSTRSLAGSTYLALTQSRGGLSGNTFIRKSSDITTDMLVTSEAFGGGAALKNYGLGLMLSGNYEDPSLTFKRSFYTKKFFARGSEFFFKKPIIEAQWDTSFGDDRNNFHLSSSLVPAENNLNKLVFYNYSNGNLVDIPNLSTFTLSLYENTGSDTKITVPVVADAASSTSLNVGKVSTGVYTSSFSYNNSITSFFDVWSVNGQQVLTGSKVHVKENSQSLHMQDEKYLSKIVNLKPEYSKDEVVKFRVFTRKKNENLNIYTVATNKVTMTNVPEAFYKVVRSADSLEVFPYTTGSVKYGKMSYDSSGSFFDFDMSMLESDYAYEIRLLYQVNNEYKEQEEIFKFRVK